VSAADPCVDWAGVRHPPLAALSQPPRIASLVPSLTELVFALGLGGAVFRVRMRFLVGRCRFAAGMNRRSNG
jgi:hypothetical protein